MLKIGEFARIGQVSVATLRHYEQVELLKPTTLDADTGYRYYVLDQLARLNRILALKDLGFSLEQISHLLETELSLEQLRGMFVLKQAQTQDLIDAEQARLTRIATRLQQIEQGGNMPRYDVLLKEINPLLVASFRAVVPLESGFEQSYQKIADYLDQHQTQPGTPALVQLYSRSEQRDNGLYIDMETAIPLSSTLPGNKQINVHTLPGGLVASTVHTGNDLSLGLAFAALHGWIRANGYQIIAAPRKIHLQRTEQMDPCHYITEVQFPIAPCATKDEVKTP